MACLYNGDIHPSVESECVGRLCLHCKYNVEAEPRKTFAERWEAQREVVDAPQRTPVAGELWGLRPMTGERFVSVLCVCTLSDYVRLVDKHGNLKEFSKDHTINKVASGDLEFMSKKCLRFSHA